MFLDGVVGAVTKTDARARTRFLSKLGCKEGAASKTL